MNGKHAGSSTAWVDPDDAPEWTDDQLERAEIADGGRILQEARGTLTKGPGRPPVDNPKERITIRLDPDVAAALRASGRGWQTRVNALLRRWLETGEGG